MTTPTNTPTEARDLVVLSHLRWTWVWQRPQHLVSRFANWRSQSGSRTWFVEEPLAADIDKPAIRHEELDGITRVWLEVPASTPDSKVLSFDSENAERYPELLAEFFASAGVPEGPEVLCYTPMALDLAQSLSPSTLAYDVMDDLASFKNAPAGLRLKQRRLFAAADVLFAGGRSLHESVGAVTSKHCHLFPSGVDVAHYEVSRQLRSARVGGRPVAGYVGVIDERLDLELLGGIASALPDWEIRVVGPITKIEESTLPVADNIAYPGMASYSELPAVMAQFDVALMPFALNEATRSISPTKTLEYLAAGLPVVSTRIADVVADYTEIVHLADDAEHFAASCLASLAGHDQEQEELIRQCLSVQNWDSIARAMRQIIDSAPVHTATPKATASELAIELKGAHARSSGAAATGLSDAALGGNRLSGSAVPTLAETAVSSATPYLRAPLQARLSSALVLHPPAGNEGGTCPTCGVSAPCPTAAVLQW